MTNIVNNNIIDSLSMDEVELAIVDLYSDSVESWVNLNECVELYIQHCNRYKELRGAKYPTSPLMAMLLRVLRFEVSENEGIQPVLQGVLR